MRPVAIRHEGAVAGPLDVDRQPRAMRTWIEGELVEALAIGAEDAMAVAVARRVQRDALRVMVHDRRN